MWDILFYLGLVALAAGGLVVGTLVVRGIMNGTSPATTLFGPRPDPRLGVVEYTRVDNRRQLVLVRRDDVEHLIMTGGPVDVVIETGIGATRRARATGEVVEAPATVFSRGPRAMGQAVGQAAAQTAAGGEA